MKDLFASGPHAVSQQSLQAHDAARGRTFPCEIWQPDESGVWPLVVFSHSSGGGRNQSIDLCRHLSSHGYVAAAMDHSEVVVPELGRPQAPESAEQKSTRMTAMIGSRVPDARFLIDFALANSPADPARIGIAGHSFGGWTALAAPDDEPRIRAVVAMAPAGSSHPKPGILPAKLAFRWGRDVPTLLLTGADDVCIPVEGVADIYARVPAAKRMIVLRRADHLHFMDNVEQIHEAVRKMKFEGDLAWIPGAMKPIAELCSGEVARRFTRGMTLAHFDAVLYGLPGRDLQTELTAQSIEATVG